MSRKDFEAWAAPEGYLLAKDDDGGYEFASTRCAYAAWRAATERAGKICDTEAKMYKAFGNEGCASAAERLSRVVREGSPQ